MSLVLVDGTALVYRAHYAFANRPLTGPGGELTSVAFGFCGSLLRLIQDRRPERLVVVFDAKGRNFRHDMYPEYKANRKPMPEELAEQLPRLQPGQFDTVLCLGFIYHTARQIELLAQLRRLEPRFLVLDARIHNDDAGSEAAALHFTTEDPNKESCTCVDDGVVAVPNRAFLELFCVQLGLETTFVDWHEQGIVDWTKLKDYRSGRRVSCLAQRPRG